MRIAGGYLRGRQIEAPKGQRAHPMSQQIRNALFNALGDISGLTVLDAYSGSGAVAFEAVSRGAAKVYAIEKDARVFKTLKANRDSLNLGNNVEVSRANCTSWVENQDLFFDIIIADPPFDQLSMSQLGVISNKLSQNGTFVVSHDSHKEITIENLQLASQSQFGNAQLSFLKFKDPL